MTNPVAVPGLVESEKRKRDPDEPFLGRAVDKGIIRFTSAKQIMLFDSESEGGCPRKWVFEYVLGKRLAKTQSLIKGVDFAEKLEHYLKTGEEVLPPILQPAKKFFPRPNDPKNPKPDDLEVEQAFATGPRGLGKDIEKAIDARMTLLSLNHFMFKDETARLKGLIQQYAGLVIHNIPVDGAADVRHRRQEFIDEDGHLRREHGDMIVVETGDLKSTSRIHPQRIKSGENVGMVLPGYAKTAAEICNNVQMVLYGRYGHNKYPDATHHRLSHYYANKKKKEAVKRTGLISVAQVLERSQRIEGVVLKMIDTAGVEKIEDVEPCLQACDTYTHVDPDDPKGERTLPGCGHRYYCPLSSSQISMGLFGYNEEHKIMGLSAFDTINSPTPANGTSQAPLPPQLDAATYAAQLEAEKQRLATQVGVCTSCAAPLMANNSSRLQDGRIVHFGCPRAAVAAPPPPSALVPSSVPPLPVVAPLPPLPVVEGAVGVRPPDAPKTDWIDSAKPLPPEEIARVEDPALRAKLEEHRRLWLEREAQKAAANPVPVADVKWCQPQCPKIIITAEILTAKKFTCHCGKSYSVTTLKPIQEGDKLVSVIPKHKPVNKLETASPPPSPSLPAAPPPSPSQSVLPQAPPPATSAPSAPLPSPPPVMAPPPPVVVAPPPPSAPPPPVAALIEGVNNGTLPLLQTSPLPPSPPTGEMTSMVEKMFVEKMFGPSASTAHVESYEELMLKMLQSIDASLKQLVSLAKAVNQ